MTPSPQLMYALALGIEEDVVGVAAGLHAHDRLAVARIKHGERGRLAIDDHDPFTNRIERHREVGLRVLDGPAHRLQARGAIEDRDLTRVRDVDEDPRPTGFELKGPG